MPQSLSKIYLHIVFSTKRRYPFLANREFRNEMHRYIGGTCNAIGCPVIAVGGAADHVHILCLLSRTRSVAEVVMDMKGQSSKWAKQVRLSLRKFQWQRGYGVFSVSESAVETVRSYINNQEEHHRRKSFKEEYLGFLEEHHVSFEEQYLWD